MKKFKEYLQESAQMGEGSLTIFDIDETLFHTTAEVVVKSGSRVVTRLNNQQFNTYQLKPGEQFDFTEFKSAEKFAESKPIGRMIAKAKAITHGIGINPASRVIIVTARANFDDKEKFLDTFRKQGLDMNKIRVERAGNITDIANVAQKKAMIIRNYLNTKQFKKVRLFDDSMENLKVFLQLNREFPTLKFEAYFAKPDGSIKTVK